MIAVVKADVDYCKFNCDGEVHTVCKYNVSNNYMYLVIFNIENLFIIQQLM